MLFTVVAIAYSFGIFGRGAACGNDKCVCNLGSGFLFNAVMMYIVLAKNGVFLEFKVWGVLKCYLVFYSVGIVFNSIKTGKSGMMKF
jgi:hypothetical protein